MIIRAIEFDDIFKFEQIGIKNGGKATLNLQKWLEAGRTKLTWCFVAEESGEFLARIIYGIFEDQPRDLKVWHFKIGDVTHKNALEIGGLLLKDSLKMLKKEGFNTVEYHLYSTTENEFDLIQTVFKSQGFDVSQEKKTFELSQVNLKTYEQRLLFKSIKEIGENEFTNAIELVTEYTLDRDDIESVSINGSKRAAELYFELLKEMDFNDNWWRVSYESNGDFVGLVVPQKLSEERGVINYIGVVPTKRGFGYVKDLLFEGSRLMIQDGLESVLADIDVQNHPLEKALNEMGFVYTRSLIVFKLGI